MELLEHPPDALHVRHVHCLVVVLEVDPTADALDGLLPFARVSHYDGAALSIVLGDAHLIGSRL